MTLSKLTFTLAFQIHKGMVREGNEDDFLVNPDLVQDTWTWANEPGEIQPGGLGALFIVADGMGGLNAGEVASRLAVESMREVFTDFRSGWTEDVLFNPREILMKGIRAAAKRIAAYPKEDPSAAGLGTTLTVGWLLHGQLHLAWVGDSRVYVLHANGALEQLNKDHSFVQELVDKGELTEEQAFYHPQKNIITRCLSDGGAKNHPDHLIVDLQSGDRILFCSDGLNTMIDNPGIQRILKEEPATMGCARRLVDEANAAGGHDNITVILVDVVNTPGGFGKVIVPSRKRKLLYLLLPVLVVLTVGTIGYFQFINRGFNTQADLEQKSQIDTMNIVITKIMEEQDSSVTTDPDDSNTKPDPAEGVKVKKNEKQEVLESTQDPLLIPDPDQKTDNSMKENTYRSADSIYHVIVSSRLISESDVEVEMKHVRFRGVPLEIVKDAENGQYKLSVESFPTRSQAEEAKARWKTRFEGAWVYARKK